MIDTQKTSDAVARIMELDAKRTQGEWRIHEGGSVYGGGYYITEPQRLTPDDDGNTAFIAATPTMDATINDLLDVVKEMVKALQVLHDDNMNYFNRE